MDIGDGDAVPWYFKKRWAQDDEVVKREGG